MINLKFMKLALEEAKKAFNIGEIPVGAVVVKNNKIISKAYNKKEKLNDVTAHAEILAIKKASKKLKNWRLINCALYVTLEPCMMCFDAIIQSRINCLVYGLDNNFNSVKTCYFKKKFPKIYGNILAKESKEIIQSFFLKQRKYFSKKII